MADAIKPARAPLPRRLALDILIRVDQTEAYADRVLDGALRKAGFQERERALTTELVYGTLRLKTALDLELQQHLAEPMTKLPPPVRAALRLGAYQLMHMRVPPYSAVDESVRLVKKKYGRLAGVVNAVLRKVAARHERGAEAATAPVDARRSHPTWMVELADRTLGPEEATALLTAQLVRPALSVRVNRQKTDPDTLVALLAQHQIQAMRSAHCSDSLVFGPVGDVTRLPGFEDGLFAVQDPAATLVGTLLAPPEGATVLDLCAAPGGKATHACEQVGPTGRVIAVDVHPGRVRLIERNAARLGHSQVAIVVADLATSEGLTAVQKTLGAPTAAYVTLDAPCSALGTLRRHPELRERQEDAIERLAALQAVLLDQAARLVAEGGVLVYAVCTWTTAEGPHQVAQFLRRHPEFELEALPASHKAFDSHGFFRTWPHRHQLDGFFAARLVRRAAILREPRAIP